MVTIDHVEKIAPSKITVTTPASAPKKEEAAKPESETRRGRKPKDE